MKTLKNKRYRLGVSRYFPTTHPRKGETTYFVDKIENYTNKYGLRSAGGSKLHTIRANYPLWARRMEKVQRGEAVIELFYWSGSPYNSKKDGSKQVVFATLDKESGCGVQKTLFIDEIGVCSVANEERKELVNVNYYNISKNDGLSVDDFKEWFKVYDLSKPMAIIQFTKFRY